MNNDPKNVVIIIHDPKKVSENLSDLLCWWQGFKVGMKFNNEQEFSPVATHGIDSAYDLKYKIDEQIKCHPDLRNRFEKPIIYSAKQMVAFGAWCVEKHVAGFGYCGQKMLDEWMKQYPEEK